MRAITAKQANEILERYQLRSIHINKNYTNGRTFYVVQGVKYYGGENVTIEVSAKTAKELGYPIR